MLEQRANRSVALLSNQTAYYKIYKKIYKGSAGEECLTASLTLECITRMQGHWLGGIWMLLEVRAASLNLPIGIVPQT